MQDYEKTFAGLLLYAIMLAAILLFSAYDAWSNREYPGCGIVEAVDHESDTVTIITPDGNLWQFDGAEDWFPGDICAVTFRDAGIPGNIYDDEIVAVRYIGYVEEE